MAARRRTPASELGTCGAGPVLESIDLTLLRILAEGRSVADAAVLLDASEHSVHRRLVRIRRELGAPNTVAAVVTALRLRLL